MLYLLVMMFVLFLAAFYGTSGDDQIQAKLDRSAIIARQMVVQHAAATRVCNVPSCPPGPIDPNPELPSALTGRTPFVAVAGEAQPRMRSYYDGEFIVTVYVEPGTADWQRSVYGNVEGQMLTTVSPVYRCSTGHWDAANRSVVVRGSSAVRRWHTNDSVVPSSQIVPLPAGLPGGGFPPDRAPIVITKRQTALHCNLLN
ncbi:hypothetical protein [Bosea sp. RAC05]|uniref:hypothetical protein n=1 Tax=Bosea sp. RAC05 TaxID=1842539 RepID=UPI00083DE1AA|nr:hypothetical protein [Bosea sp. RAC05]AOG03432.1 hypothetical protein BSY19_5237 [Bosea sp. RAC05]